MWLHKFTGADPTNYTPEACDARPMHLTLVAGPSVDIGIRTEGVVSVDGVLWSFLSQIWVFRRCLEVSSDSHFCRRHLYLGAVWGMCRRFLTLPQTLWPRHHRDRHHRQRQDDGVRAAAGDVLPGAGEAAALHGRRGTLW